jgi:hypothetical protein
MINMSAEEHQAVEYFLQWMTPNGGGLAQWIEHFLNQGDEAKLKQIKEIYDKIKQIFGF